MDFLALNIRTSEQNRGDASSAISGGGTNAESTRKESSSSKKSKKKKSKNRKRHSSSSSSSDSSESSDSSSAESSSSSDSSSSSGKFQKNRIRFFLFFFHMLSRIDVQKSREKKNVKSTINILWFGRITDYIRLLDEYYILDTFIPFNTWTIFYFSILGFPFMNYHKILAKRNNCVKQKTISIELIWLSIILYLYSDWSRSTWYFFFLLSTYSWESD